MMKFIKNIIINKYFLPILQWGFKEKKAKNTPGTNTIFSYDDDITNNYNLKFIYKCIKKKSLFRIPSN